VNDDGLPPLREVIARTGLAARKSLGQNFLFDLNLTRRIARAAAPLEGFAIVEIGPGPGGLTRALLIEGANNVIAIERDPRALPALQEISERYPGKLEITEANAMAVNWRELVSGPAKIAANLPYNIATPLLTGWLTSAWPPWFSSATLMFQKEVAERIVSPPGTAGYGRLSVLCQWSCTVRKLFDVHRSAFTPPPKVTSSVVQLVPHQQRTPPCEVKTLERITAAAFGQRRKMLRTSLKPLGHDTEALLAAAGIPATERAEQLAPNQFARLAQIVENGN
jgi:16S rRNA (adenine1518-N6/adenine1519-N6)-dimethyltransferase